MQNPNQKKYISYSIIRHGYREIFTNALCLQFQTIDINKPVCNDLCLESEAGDIKVTSLYAAKSYFNTRRGNVEIGTCHKDAMINMQQLGNLNIGRFQQQTQ